MLLPVFLIIGLYGFGNKVFTTIKGNCLYNGWFTSYVYCYFIFRVSYNNEFGHWSFAYDKLMTISTLDHNAKVWLFF